MPTSHSKSDTDPRLLLLSPQDNVVVLRAPIHQGETIRVLGQRVTLREDISIGYKLAYRAIPSGEKVIKYGATIGTATKDIALGECVHTHNIKSNYTPTHYIGGKRS